MTAPGRRADREGTAPFWGDARTRREAARFALLAFLAVRVGLTVVALVASGFLAQQDPVDVPGRTAPADEPGWHNLWTVWERHDALWYLRIADTGYSAQDGSAAFFPLYPMLVGILSWPLGGSELAAALLLSNGAFLASLALMYLLGRDEWGPEVARRSTALLAVFPAAVVLVAPYTESLFLLLVIACLRAARQSRWPLAGALGALASATRSLGLLLGAAMVAEAVHQAARRDTTWRERAVPVLSAGLVAAGTLAYMAYWQGLAGNAMAPFDAQAQWGRDVVFPLESVWLATQFAFTGVGRPPNGFFLLDWLVVMPMLVAAGWSARRLRPIYSVFVWANLLVLLTFVWQPRPFMSLPRFVLVLFPLFWVPALAVKDRPGWYVALVGASSALLALTTALFVQWYFVL